MPKPNTFNNSCRLYPKFNPRNTINEALRDESPPQKFVKRPSLGTLGEDDYYCECNANVYVPFPYDTQDVSKIRIDYTIELEKKTWGIAGASLEIKQTEIEVSFTLIDGEKETYKTLPIDPSKLKIEEVGDGIIPTRVGDINLTINEDESVNYDKSTIEVLY